MRHIEQTVCDRVDDIYVVFTVVVHYFLKGVREMTEQERYSRGRFWTTGPALTGCVLVSLTGVVAGPMSRRACRRVKRGAPSMRWARLIRLGPTGGDEC